MVRGPVAIVTPGFWPSVGGAERYHEFGARALAARREVVVLTSARSLGRPAGPERAVTPSGISVRYLPSYRLAGEKMISPVALWNALDDVGPGLVWTNQPSATGDLAGLFARLHGIPWVASYHADILRGPWYAGPYTRLEMRWLRGADRVLVTSARYARRLVVRGVESRRLRVAVPPPYLGALAGPLEDSSAGPWPPGPEHPYLFVGVLDRSHRYKRLDLLLEAIRQTRGQGQEVHLMVVGDGADRPHWEAEAHRLGVAGQVRFVGRLSDRDLARQFRASWAVVVPADTETEGFGSVALEGAVLGVPTVTTRAVAVGDYLSKVGAAEVVPAGDAGALAQCLRDLWDDPARRHGLARAARDSAEEFSSERLTAELGNAVLAVDGPPSGPVDAELA